MNLVAGAIALGASAAISGKLLGNRMRGPGGIHASGISVHVPCHDLYELLYAESGSWTKRERHTLAQCVSQLNGLDHFDYIAVQLHQGIIPDHNFSQESLHIHFTHRAWDIGYWAESKTMRMPPEFCGVKVTEDHVGRKPRPGVIVLYDRQGIPLAEWVPEMHTKNGKASDHLYLLWSVLPTESAESRSLFEALLIEVACQRPEIAKAFSPRGVLTTRAADDLLGLGNKVEQVERAAALCESLEHEYQAIQSKCAALQTDIGQLDTRLRLRKQRLSKLPADRWSLEELSTLKGIASVTRRHEILVVRTEEIVVKHPRTSERHRLGCFEMHLYPEASYSVVRYFNLTYQLDSPFGLRHAPHVDSEGVMLLGDADEVLIEALFEEDYRKVIKCARKFLMHVPDTPVTCAFLERYPRVEQEYTHRGFPHLHLTSKAQASRSLSA